MTPPTILFNTYARVYNLRFLLLAAVAFTALHAYNRVHWRHNDNSIPLWLSMFFSLFLPVHHLAALFKWPGNWLASIDLAMNTIEIGVTSLIVYYIYDYQEMKLDTPVPVICLLVALMVSAVFRAATIYNSEGRICDQQFEFLGGCAPVDPAYTPWTILHHRFPAIVAFIRERLGVEEASIGKGDVETKVASPTCDAAERGAFSHAPMTERTPLLPHHSQE
ncbi:hypothetical protein C8R45DRAFT_1041642 [Mycena sanguinolenta]|nr:hypothetical protein C8R45DRAFT_1041642 [Mycena sanguinolenta]